MLNNITKLTVMQTRIYFLPFILLFALAACNPEDEIIKDPSVKLEFSTDTVLFDTVFTRLGSVTKRFVVHNTFKKSVKISSIRLAGGENSPYRINIDGEAVYSKEDYIVYPEDSFYIFVDVTIDPDAQNQPFIVKDSIIFETNGNLQDIKLVAWGQNAHYLTDSVLTTNQVWTNDRPYVIYNSILVDSLHTLTIQPGVQIYSNGGSKIYVWGTLVVNGTINEPVVMQGVRLESYYKNAPGQWGGIRILPRSVNNYFKNLHVRNAVIGIEVDSLPVNPPTPNLILENVRIENASAVCLLGYTAHIRAFNCVFDNSCQYIAVGDLGGIYEFYHCTFAHSNCECSSRYPALAFYNTDYTVNGTSYPMDLNLVIRNSIIWGNAGDIKEDEIELKKTGQGNYTVAIDHTLIETKDLSFNINNNLLNKDPLFTFPCQYNYKLDTLSPAKDKGIFLGFTETLLDNGGNARNAGDPDLGAFERIE